VRVRLDRLHGRVDRQHVGVRHDVLPVARCDVDVLAPEADHRHAVVGRIAAEVERHFRANGFRFTARPHVHLQHEIDVRLEAPRLPFRE
jgi:hypothetical protein